MKAKINTDLFPIIDVGMYNSVLDPDSMFSDVLYDMEDMYVDPEYFWDNFSMQDYVKEVERQAQVFFKGEVYEVEGMKFKIKAGEIYSPKYYNFATDQIDLTVEFNKRHVLKFAKDNQEWFEIFLKNNYTSYDGFISHTANNYPEWLEDFKDNNSQAIGAVLTYIFTIGGEIEDIKEDFYEQCQSNIYSSEFCNWEPYDEEVKVIEKYIQENYMIIDLDNFAIDYEFEHITDVKAKALEVYKSINSLSGDLWKSL
jgi:hypothetical protein